MSETPAAPYPEIDEANRFFWTAGEAGELKFLRCQACRAFVHPPAPRCRACLGEALAPEVVSGRATVEAYTVNHHPWHPAFPPPYVVAIVSIEEDPGVRLTTNIVDCAPEAVRLGLAVQAQFRQAGPAWLPVFAPRGQSAFRKSGDRFCDQNAL
jgi:uncharacterized OB-fold protein